MMARVTLTLPVLGLLVCWTMSFTDSYRLICRRNKLRVSCPRGNQVHIQSAIRRRQATEAGNRRAFLQITKKCSGQKECRIPCSTKNKYMVIKYECFKSSAHPRMRLVFEDNFDTLNFSLWNHEVTTYFGGFQKYVNNRTNSYVRDGILYIKPTLSSNMPTESSAGGEYLKGKHFCTGAKPPQGCKANVFPPPIQSARMRSDKMFNFKYGKIEIRAMMPAGDWIWPALWLLPTHEEYGIWPASGEIDLVETRGNQNLTLPDGEQIGITQAGQTLHWGPYWPIDPYYLTRVTKYTNQGTFASDFHTYGAEWNETQFSFLVDGVILKTIQPPDGFWKLGNFDRTIPGSYNPWDQTTSNKMAPFDKEFFIVMNVAVGGVTFFPDNAVNVSGKKPWNDTVDAPEAAKDFWKGRAQWIPTWNLDKSHGEDAAMKVDFIRVWQTEPVE